MAGRGGVGGLAATRIVGGSVASCKKNLADGVGGEVLVEQKPLVFAKRPSCLGFPKGFLPQLAEVCPQMTQMGADEFWRMGLIMISLLSYFHLC
jgi:hypothetical protein